MKRIIGLAALAIGALACGSAGDADFEEEIAQIEQPYVGLHSPDYQFGAQTGSGRRSCNRTSSGQTCTFARKQIIELAHNPALWTNGERARLSSVASALNAAYTLHTFNVVDSATTPGANVTRMILSKGAVSGTLSGNMDGYRSVSFFSPTSLTEGQHPGLAAPVGNYQTHGSCTATIDVTDINNKGANATEDSRLLGHAFGSSALICMGIGARDDATGSYSQRPISLASDLSAGTAGEICRADNLSDLADTADYSEAVLGSCPSN